MEIVINGIKPMGAVRMTRKGKWTNESAQRYLNYKAYLTREINKRTNLEKIEPGQGIHVTINFRLPIPESYSIKEKSLLPGTPHMKKPDIDNLIKGVFDAINGLLWADDNQVYSVTATKVYATEPGIEIVINQVGE